MIIILVIIALSVIFAVVEEAAKSFLEVKVSGERSAQIIVGLFPRLFGAIVGIYLLMALS